MFRQILVQLFAFCLLGFPSALQMSGVSNSPYYLYVYSSNLTTGIGQFDILDSSGVMLIEDVASYYPPVDPGYNVLNWRYSPSGRWIVATTKAVRPESVANLPLGRNFLIDTTTDTVMQITPPTRDDGGGLWAPTQDIFAFGSDFITGVIPGFTDFQFYNPSTNESQLFNVGDGSPMGIGPIRSWLWAQSENRLMMLTSNFYVPDVGPSRRLSSLFTVRMDGSNMVMLYSQEGDSDGFPFGVNYDWSVLGILTDCASIDKNSFRQELCLIDPQSGEWESFYQLPPEFIEADSTIGRFSVSPDGETLFLNIWTGSEVEGETRYSAQLIAHDLNTNSFSVLQQTDPGYGVGVVQISPYIPADILDGTRLRWAAPADAPDPA